MRKQLKRTLLCLVALMAIGIPAFAAPAVTLDNLTGLTLGNPPFTLGWTFHTNQAVDVTALGVFDDSQNGLTDIYEIGIWDSGGLLVASGTLRSGVLVNQFRYVSISTVTLAGGADYQIGALYLTGNDPLIFPGFASNFATDPSITFNGSRFASGGVLANPTSSGGPDAAYFGPNFLTASVPEPGSLTLLAAGLMGMAGLALKKRQ